MSPQFVIHGLNFFFNVFYFIFWDTERQSMNGGGAEREEDTESETGSRLWAISPEPDAGLKLTDREIVTWAEVGRLTDWATQAPLCLLVLKMSFVGYEMLSLHNLLWMS